MPQATDSLSLNRYRLTFPMYARVKCNLRIRSLVGVYHNSKLRWKRSQLRGNNRPWVNSSVLSPTCCGSPGAVPVAEPRELHLAPRASPKQPPHSKGHPNVLEAAMAHRLPNITGLLSALPVISSK